MSLNPQVSICVPDLLQPEADSVRLQKFCDTVTQFFAKFPLEFEILFATGFTLERLQIGERARWVTVPASSKSRAQYLEALSVASAGEILVVCPLDLAIPLGEIFRMLQELYIEPDLQLVVGNRNGKKKKIQAQFAPVKVPRLETFFQGIIKEKVSWPFHDFFCPVLAVRKSAFGQIQPHLKSRGWHWTPEILRATALQNLRFLELDVHTSGASTAAPWYEVFSSLAFVVFRI